jgi:protein TonB
VTDANLVNLIAYGAQVLIVVSAGAIGVLIVRLPGARARLAYWRLIVAMCLTLPVLTPPMESIVLMPEPVTDIPVAMTGVEISGGPSGTRVSAAASVGWILAGGAAIRGGWLGLGLLALARLRRRSEAAALHENLEELRKAVAPSAEIRWHGFITQPVAFGLRRPIVLLPRSVASLPLDAQRAVVCHELLHVARRDWAWMLGEEAVRCVLWFHPAIWFALGKVQLSREELVDEEVVRITGVRQAYARALAMFAGEPAAFAAAMPFIRRRHLLSRIKKLSEEHTMSRLRIACGFVVLVAVIAGSGWAAASVAPLRGDGIVALPLPSAVQAPVPLLMIDPAPLPVVGGPVRNQTQNAAVTYRVAPVYPEAARGHGVEAVVTVRVTVGAAGEVTNVEVVRTRLSTERDVTDPTFWASQPSRLFGQSAEDAVRQWRFEATGATRRVEVPVAFAEQNKMVFVPAVHAATPPAAARVSDAPEAEQVSARVRAGGVIRVPQVVTKVPPTYPAAAKDANIQGVVILEIVIDSDGSVKEGRVLRSIPLLDQAALEAVSQWTYQPTLLNGVPVEVIVTVTVNFTLSQ